MTKTDILRKPLFGRVYGVRDKIVREAKKNPPLLVRTERDGDMVVDPYWVEKNCEIIEAVFKIPDRPMRLYKIAIEQKDKEKELEELAKQGIF